MFARKGSGQNEAVSAVAKAIHSRRVGLIRPETSVGSFIFSVQQALAKPNYCKARRQCSAMKMQCSDIWKNTDDKASVHLRVTWALKRADSLRKK